MATRSSQSIQTPVFDRDGVKRVDRAAIEEFGIPGIVLMENAARGLADEAINMLTDCGTNPHVLIICGSGNNGGDGYALARHLHNRNIDITLVSLKDPKSGSDAAINQIICRKVNLTEINVDQLDYYVRNNAVSLIVDAIFGTGLDRPIEGTAAQAINWINQQGKPVLAVDVPSGLDCNTGEVLGTAVHATKTVTFVGIKIGFTLPEAQKYVGEVRVVDIGVPIELIERFSR